jgi:hypothetical protein
MNRNPISRLQRGNLSRPGALAAGVAVGRDEAIARLRRLALPVLKIFRKNVRASLAQTMGVQIDDF